MKIPVTALLIEAFALPWRERHAFTRALALPVAIMFTVAIARQVFGERIYAADPWLHSLGSVLCYAATMAFLAVTCHRQVLIAGNIRTRWGARETKYLLWILGVGFFSGMLTGICSSFAWSIISPLQESSSFEQWRIFAYALYMLPIAYVLSRFALVLPAVALDQKPSLSWAWKLTQGNGWRLAALIALLPWIVNESMSRIFRHEATLLETVLVILLNCLLIAVEVVAMSLSYKYLAKNKRA